MQHFAKASCAFVPKHRNKKLFKSSRINSLNTTNTVTFEIEKKMIFFLLINTRKEITLLKSKSIGGPLMKKV